MGKKLFIHFHVEEDIMRMQGLNELLFVLVLLFFFEMHGNESF